MTIWLAVCWAVLMFPVSSEPEITKSKIILVRDNPGLEELTFLAVLQVPEDLAREIPAEQFLEQNMDFKDIASNTRTVIFKNHFRNPQTKKLEPNQFIGVLQRQSTKHTEIMATKGKFIITKMSELVGYRIGLHTDLPQGFAFQSKRFALPNDQQEQPKAIQSGWAIEVEIEGQGAHTEMIPTKHSLIWLTANPSGFTVSLPDEKDPMKIGKQVFAGNDLVIYRYAIFPSPPTEPKEQSGNSSKKT